MKGEQHIGLTDSQIVEGLRRRDSRITRDYFYGYCRIAYHVYNRQYDLDSKPGLDFYSLAHEYYLALDKHGFRQLDDRKPGLSLKTWMVNGFRFLVLDSLKAYNKEMGIQSLDNGEGGGLQFDLPDNNFSEDFRNTVFEICHKVLGRDSRSSLILQMMLIDGFKGKEAAAQLGITPSAVTQQFHKLMETVVIPYFRRYYTAPETLVGDIGEELYEPRMEAGEKESASNRITPERITSLRPDEIFVFGSNLQGMHGGGTARIARLYFGAVLGNGDGPQGQSYAIPTMQGGVDSIRPFVDRFIDYAETHPKQTFLVTPIGCGLAGFTPEDIAPLFRKAVDVPNINLPLRFWQVLEDIG